MYGVFVVPGSEFDRTEFGQDAEVYEAPDGGAYVVDHVDFETACGHFALLDSTDGAHTSLIAAFVHRSDATEWVNGGNAA